MSILLLENYIKELLKENKEIIKKINVFDFDDTIFKSSKVPDNWNNRKKGYWWNSLESLHQSSYDNDLKENWIEDTVSAIKDSMSDPESITVLCTARLNRVEVKFQINSMLREKGLIFDNIFFKPQRKKVSSSKYKLDTIKMLLNAYSYANELSFWEDNEENLNVVKNAIEKNNKTNSRKIKYNSNLVT